MLNHYRHILEYVDSDGELQYVDDKELLLAAAGSLGLLGITTAITYRVLTFLKIHYRVIH